MGKNYLVFDPRTDVDRSPIDAYVSDKKPKEGSYTEIDTRVAECYNALKEAHNGLIQRLFTLNKEIQKSIGPLLYQAYEEGRLNGENPYNQLIEKE